MRIECSDCTMYQSSHCDDCLVTALLHPPDGIVEIDEDLDGPLQALTGAGLIPVLKFRPRDPDPGETAVEASTAEAG
ncbi:MAG: hypothetical protein QOG04_1705 [Actinomycetota bacterium]|jgi:hypothetical protein|nr:hypothetical protein [Actinomycetota bacterium]